MHDLATLVFSKNRACQLELLLRTLEEIPAAVLFVADTEYRAGYEKLMQMYPNVEFEEQGDYLNSQIAKRIKSHEHTLFLVDDDVMIRPFDKECAEFQNFVNNPNILSLSLSLCPRFRRHGLPELDENNTWEWLPYSNRARGFALRIWGHPMTVGGNIFRTEDILFTITKVRMDTPNYLEAALNRHIPDRPLMMCFDQPKIVNNNANQVQSDFPSRTANVSLEALQENFMQGHRLSLAHIQRESEKARTYRLSVVYEFDPYAFLPEAV